MPENAKTKSRSKLRLTALCGVFAALVFIGTQIRIPTAIGYINLGDGVILIASYFIGPAAFFPGAIGSALSDLIAGYPMYIAPTFLIKGLMGLVAALIMTKSHGRKAMGFIVRLIASAAAFLPIASIYPDSSVISLTLTLITSSPILLSVMRSLAIKEFIITSLLFTGS